jgi:hypothetical protein
MATTIRTVKGIFGDDFCVHTENSIYPIWGYSDAPQNVELFFNITPDKKVPGKYNIISWAK